MFAVVCDLCFCLLFECWFGFACFKCCGFIGGLIGLCLVFPVRLGWLLNNVDLIVFFVCRECCFCCQFDFNLRIVCGGYCLLLLLCLGGCGLDRFLFAYCVCYVSLLIWWCCLCCLFGILFTTCGGLIVYCLFVVYDCVVLVLIRFLYLRWIAGYCVVLLFRLRLLGVLGFLWGVIALIVLLQFQLYSLDVYYILISLICLFSWV